MIKSWETTIEEEARDRGRRVEMSSAEITTRELVSEEEGEEDYFYTLDFRL